MLWIIFVFMIIGVFIFSSKNDSKVISLRQQAKSIGKEFAEVCVTTRAGLMGELDDGIILSFRRMFSEYVDSKDFQKDINKNYGQMVAKYGTFELAVYNLILSRLMHGPQNRTTDVMEEVARARIKHL